MRKVLKEKLTVMIDINNGYDDDDYPLTDGDLPEA